MPVQEGNSYKPGVAPTRPPLYLNATARENRNMALADHLDREIDRLMHLPPSPTAGRLAGLDTLSRLILARDTVRGW